MHKEYVYIYIIDIYRYIIQIACSNHYTQRYVCSDDSKSSEIDQDFHNFHFFLLICSSFWFNFQLPQVITKLAQWEERCVNTWIQWFKDFSKSGFGVPKNPEECYEWYCWWTKSCTTKDDDYPVIYRVFNHPRWCRILSINSIRLMISGMGMVETWHHW